jgi:hypothetical protein
VIEINETFCEQQVIKDNENERLFITGAGVFCQEK